MATADSTRTTRTPFNASHALEQLERMQRQITASGAIASTAATMEEGREDPDYTTLGLFHAIEDLTTDARSYHLLRDMLEGVSASGVQQ